MDQRQHDQINSQSHSLAPQHPQLQLQMASVNAASFGAKYASKREVYRFLTSEARVYLPSYDTVTIFHMRDLVAGRRRMIKQDDVKVISVPFFDGLSIETMLEWAAARPENIMEVFPLVKREVNKLPRAYIANCIYTLSAAAF